jgi:hypothetical protein
MQPELIIINGTIIVLPICWSLLFRISRYWNLITGVSQCLAFTNRTFLITSVPSNLHRCNTSCALSFWPPTSLSNTCICNAFARCSAPTQPASAVPAGSAAVVVVHHLRPRPKPIGLDRNWESHRRPKLNRSICAIPSIDCSSYKSLLSAPIWAIRVAFGRSANSGHNKSAPSSIVKAILSDSSALKCRPYAIDTRRAWPKFKRVRPYFDFAPNRVRSTLLTRFASLSKNQNSSKTSFRRCFACGTNFSAQACPRR